MKVIWFLAGAFYGGAVEQYDLGWLEGIGVATLVALALLLVDAFADAFLREWRKERAE